MRQIVNNYPRWILLIFVMFSAYIIYSQVTTTLYFFYGLVTFIALLVHVLIIKNFNFKFNYQPYNNIRNINNLILGSKLFITQFVSCLLANWWVINTLEQGGLNIKTINISINLITDNNYIIIIGILVNWLVLISVLLGINFCKQYFNYPYSWSSLTKCLCTAVTARSLINYKIIRNIEGNSKTAGLISIFIVATTVCYQLIINKYNLLNFFDYPLIVACITMMISAYFFKIIHDIIVFASKKTSIDFIKIFIIIAVFMGAIIFIINQVILTKISLLPVMANINNNWLNYLFNNIIFNQNRIIILVLSINVLLAIWAAYLLLDQINQYHIKTIYSISLFGAILLSLTLPKLIIFLNNNIVSTVIILAMLIILLTQYQNIYSVHELISPRCNYKKSSKIKTTFVAIIQQMMFAYFVFLGAYYIMNWILLIHVLAIISILFLVSLLMLLIKCVIFKTKNHLLKTV